jgi:hypothetical protein
MKSVSVTFVIPLAPYHADHLQTALASVRAQTVEADVIVVRDDALRGAGCARNVGLAAVETPFVVFLDADDALAPTFLERCLSVFDHRRYVYTDHWQDDRLVEAPCQPWVNRSWHVVTTLLPTAWVRAVGGFDETLSGGEDTDLYLRLNTSGYCGKRLPEPLFYYGKDGRRAKAFVNGPEFQATLDEFTRRYGGKIVACNGCGENESLDTSPVGERQPGDVLAKALWGGNRSVRGTITGRMYPRTGNGKTEWVDPADIAAAPHLWRREDILPPAPQPARPGWEPRIDVLTTAPVTPRLNGVAEIGQALFAPQPAPPTPVAPAAVQPNVRRATALYAQAVNPPLALTGGELDALKRGDTVEVTDEQVKIKRRRAPDKVTQRKPRSTSRRSSRRAAS